MLAPAAGGFRQGETTEPESTPREDTEEIYYVKSVWPNEPKPKAPAYRVVPRVDTEQNRLIGFALANQRGWGGEQWNCLDQLYRRESGWNHLIWNRQGSGAYGIPQALPANKMASAGADWLTNPETQIRWGLGYIAARYKDPCSALKFQISHNWY